MRPSQNMHGSPSVRTLLQGYSTVSWPVKAQCWHHGGCLPGVGCDVYIVLVYLAAMTAISRTHNSISVHMNTQALGPKNLLVAVT
jgi:hypothetical protein